MNKFHSTFTWTVCIARDLKPPKTKHKLDVQDFKYGEIVFPTQDQNPPLSFLRAEKCVYFQRDETNGHVYISFAIHWHQQFNACWV